MAAEIGCGMENAVISPEVRAAVARAAMAHESAPEVAAKLRALNPRARVDSIEFYADAYVRFREASENLREFGAIVRHPRTEEMIANPYLAIQKGAEDRMLKLRLNTGDLWAPVAPDPAKGPRKK